MDTIDGGVLTGLISTLSPSKIARLVVSLRLLDRSFTPVLKEKSSDQYTTLKTTVVKAVSNVIQRTKLLCVAGQLPTLIIVFRHCLRYGNNALHLYNTRHGDIRKLVNTE